MAKIRACGYVDVAWVKCLSSNPNTNFSLINPNLNLANLNPLLCTQPHMPTFYQMPYSNRISAGPLVLTLLTVRLTLLIVLKI